MTVAIMQPYLFPYIGYFQLIQAVDKFVILDDVNYINKGYINRNVIKDGRFTVPIVGASQNKKINELEFVSGEYARLMDRVGMVYGNYPNCPEVMEHIGQNLFRRVTTAIQISIMDIGNYLGIDFGAKLIPNYIFDTGELKGQDRIIEICNQLGADTYINPAGGSHLYDHKRFNEEGIELKFLNCNCRYWNSIIDVLMSFTKEEVKTFLTQYTLTNEPERIANTAL